jgi:serine/threonine protein phosphatase 1
MASIWAIGDIHGQLSPLETLLGKLPRQADDYTVFIGDYIDRGPDSAGVARRVLEEYDAAPERTILLWGNHEDMAAYYFGLPRPSLYLYEDGLWLENGGIAALQSFDVENRAILTGNVSCPDDLARLFSLLKPFWRPPTEVFPELSHVIYAHAGVSPGSQPEDETGDTLLWIRDDFLAVHDDSGRLVVHGHTPYNNVRVMQDKIGIDTGSVYGNLLTCLQLPERIIFQVNAKNLVTKRQLPEFSAPSKAKKLG